MVFLGAYIIIQSMTMFRFWTANESFLTYRKTITNFTTPKLVKVEDRYLKFEPKRDKLGDQELVEHYAMYRQFAKGYDVLLFSEIFILVIVYTLETIDYAAVGIFGPIDTAMLISQFISNVVVFYLSFKHRRVNGAIKGEHDIVFVQSSMIDSLGPDEMKTVVGTVITILIAVFFKR